ncbi:hypothetical protein [Nocardia farcinica]|uniref:hypothetical protein n=1 Tax=Nocardia farcinica TaxID=37329 RepID=UPI003442920C
MPQPRWVAGVLAAALALTVTGCSSDDSDTAPAAQTTPALAPASAPAPAPDVQIGVPFQISNAKGPTATVTLTAIEIDPKCTTSYGQRPTPAGTHVALEFDVATTANPPTKWISELWFDEETPDGYTKKLPNSDDLCLADRDDLATTWAPNSKYRGWVLVEVSDPRSTLLMKDIWDGRTTPEVHRIPLPGA